DATPVTAGRLDTGTGFAAVETPRGRLHHLAALDRSDRVARYLILAPTEWNFAAGGPCAAALAGIEIGPGDPSGTIRRLASLFDPCVECRVEVRGTAGGADDRQEGS
ncbi:nickel-dependent hydrogenase large subunit, partial [Rhodoplanes sp. TEM]